MGEINIEKTSFDGKRFTSKVSTTDDLTKFIKMDTLFIEYDTEIYADESVLNLPLTATILPLAWLTGSHVHVGKLDKTFKESMDALQREFAKMYPLIPFSTEIKAEELVENKTRVRDPDSRTGLLFSGGVDSTYSLIKNLEHNPRLIMIWGLDTFPYPERSDHWEKALTIYREFAKKKKLAFNVLKTNISQILNTHRIAHRFHKELYHGDVRNALQHSLVLLPPAAPLSVGRFDKFILAASGSPASNIKLRPRAARPWFDDKIIWADLTVENHGFILRKNKIFALAEYMRDDNITLRVCLRSKLIDGELNDCSCPKCLKTIASLIIAGADPNDCGFKVNEFTFTVMKSFVMSRKSSRINQNWYEKQEIARDGIDFEVPGSRKFFEWLRDFDVESTEINLFYTDLYMALPYWLAKNLDRIYRRVRINVHDEPYKRE